MSCHYNLISWYSTTVPIVYFIRAFCFLFNNKPLNQAELDEISANLSDTEYCESEFGRDDDAEDDLPLHSLPLSSRNTPITYSSSSVVESEPSSEPSTSSNFTLRKILHRDSDDEEVFYDSLADPEFDPIDWFGDPPPNKLRNLFSTHSEPSSDEELQEVICA